MQSWVGLICNLNSWKPEAEKQVVSDLPGNSIIYTLIKWISRSCVVTVVQREKENVYRDQGLSLCPQYGNLINKIIKF